MAVKVLRVWVNTCRGWDMDLVNVHCLAAWARIPRDCWDDLTKVLEDWAKADSEMVWEGSLLAVQAFSVSVRIQRVCSTVSKNVVNDWAKAEIETG